MKQKSISSAGGPYVLMSPARAASWRGVNGHSFDLPKNRIEQFFNSVPDEKIWKYSDYTAACSTEGYLSFIPNGMNDILVINDDPSEIFCEHDSDDTWHIIKCLASDSDEDFSNELRIAKDCGKFQFFDRILCANEGFVIFDSSIDFKKIDPSDLIKINCQSGLLEIFILQHTSEKADIDIVKIKRRPMPASQ